MKKIIVLLFVITNIAYAQEIKPFKVSFEYNIDDKGNAKVAYSMKMNASQWDNFKQSYGNNLSLLKRQMERSLPAYFLSDFNYQEDAMNRSYSLTFNAYGVCKVDQSGKWVAELNSKNPDITKLPDNIYMLIYDMSMGNGQLMQANVKFIFPASASNIMQDKDSFGNARFTFEMAGASTTGKAMQYSGIGLIALGIILGFVKSRKG